MRHRNIFLHVSGLLILGILFFSYELASAQQPTPSDDEVNAIAQELYCPICENIPLDVCPTEACHDWRELIRQMLAEGKSPGEIKQYFVDHYGARVLSEPPMAGFGWLVYVVPLVALLTGGILFTRAYKKWTRNPEKGNHAEPSEPKAISDDETRSRLEEELRKRN
jgi:cytochrome c-type biogenesis protein CcmH